MVLRVYRHLFLSFISAFLLSFEQTFLKLFQEDLHYNAVTCIPLKPKPDRTKTQAENEQLKCSITADFLKSSRKMFLKCSSAITK